MKMLKKIVLFLLIGVNLFCSDSVTKLINPQELLNYYKAKEGKYKWGISRDNGSQLSQSVSEIEIKVDGAKIFYAERSSIETRELIYDYSFNLIKKEIKLSDTRFDRVVYETRNNKIHMEKFKNGKSIEKKEKDMKNIFDADKIIIEYLYSKGYSLFNGDMLTPEGKYNMEYRLTESNDIEKLGKAYKFPDEFKKNIKMKQDYKVYIGGMTGIVANFYPHKWYYIIDKTTGEMIGSFGGNPKEEAEFGYKLNR